MTASNLLRQESGLFSDATGVGVYFSGSTGTLKYPMIVHEDLDPTFKDFGSYTNLTRVL